MTKQIKIIMVHGWGGDNEGGFFKPLNKEFEKNNFKVISPNMPDTMNPKIDIWISNLKDSIGEINDNTYFLGHSIGCQTIMRLLEQLDEKVKVGGAIFLAGWFNLTDNTWDEDYTLEIAKPWIETKINFKKILAHTKKFFLILSDDDPYVPLSDSKLFKKNLNAEIKIINNRGHIEELKKEEIKEIIDFIKK